MTRNGWTNITVLEWLVGLPWNELARSYVSALRPSFVRVSTGFLTSDAREWRVTVMTDKDGIITEITQEVAVELPEGVDNGYELRCALDKAREEIPATEVFVVVAEDRHTDPEITVHVTRESADAAVEEFQERYDDEWVDKHTSTMEESGWVYLADTDNDDGPSVRIEIAALEGVS